MTSPSSNLLDLAEVTIRNARSGSTLVSDVNLSLAQGSALAIVGESGSGKSLLARAILGLLPDGLEADGRIRLDGQELGRSARSDARRRGRDIALVMQDPFTILDPLTRAGRQIEESLAVAGGRKVSGSGSRPQVLAALAEVGLDDPAIANRFPHELSGGMRQRVAIAAALAGGPRLLVADEPTTALDASTQRDILRLIRSLQVSRGMGLILITHDLRVAFATCDRTLVLYAGMVMEVRTSKDLAAASAHPYTAALLAAEPDLARDRAVLGIPGRVPRAADVVGQCAFADRCAHAVSDCVASRPPLREFMPAQLVACHRAGEVDLQAPLEAPADPVTAGPLPDIGTPLLRVSGLSKRFGSGSKGVTALDAVDLSIGAGEGVALVGESGSGKSTLARCLVGLAAHDSGSIWVDGLGTVKPNQGSRKALLAYRRTVQMIFQDPYASLSPARSIGATIAESVRVRDPVRPRAALRHEVADLLKHVGLPPGYAARRPVALSGGERQRAAIARALAMRPRLLICDEPVSAVDVSVQAQIVTLLRSLRDRDGIALLFITHDLAVVPQIAARTVVLFRGRVVEEGPTARVLRAPAHAYTRALTAAVPGRDTDTGNWLEPVANDEAISGGPVPSPRLEERRILYDRG